ncbi:caspase recruitment domain-containing protein 10-like isoform X1 [Haliotis rubra]|uniref:caspase recruitment domain-containing protein 10-like isoform X1 n=1 Tax=Haliotis rubra TaxID=36100 RepID=UPI001EE543FC|nr:caspase recruitment domain-containing protein 10-like isoform X1 [Haliotis rubra]
MDNVQQADMDDTTPERTKLDYSSLTEENFCDFLEDHFNDLIRSVSPPVFFGQLRSARVLSESDCDEINNFYCNPTRRSRARTFLNILLTKGLDGFKQFMECLEYEYPHVFQKITNRIAKSPPSGYERHDEGRISQNLEEFSRMGFRVANLNNQRNDLFNQLEELQSMLEYAEKENKDLEREIASLRPYAMDNQQLLEKQLEADKEIRNLKDENREFMRKNIQYRDDVERQMSRIDELLVDREDLENNLKERNNELERMNQSQDVLIERFEEERKKSQRLINIATRRERHTDDNSDRPRAQNFKTRIEILQCDLEAEREKVKEMIETLEMTQAELISERQASETLRCEKLKLQRESDQSQLFLKHAERRNEQYFKTIQQLEKEKRKAEEEKILAQQKCWDISDQKQRLFVAKHNLEQKYDRLRQNYERIRSDCRSKPEEAVDGGGNTLTCRHISPNHQRLSPESVRPTPLPLLKTARGDTDPAAIQEGASQQHPRQPGVSTLAATFKTGGDDQSNDSLMCQQSFSVRNTVTSPSCERDSTAKGLRPLIARKPRLKNHSDSMVVNISASMKKVSSTQSPATADDDSDPTCRSDDDYDEDHQSGSGFSIDQETSSSGSSDVQRDADVFCIRSDLLPADSQYLRWFDSQTGMGISTLETDGGEQKNASDSEENMAKLNMKNFYVRSNVTWEDQSKEGSIPIQEGEFLYISDVLKPTFFLVNKVEPTSGHHMKRRASGTVPDYELAKMCTRRSSQGVITPEPQGNKGLIVRRDAIRSRDYSPYTVIAPLKALMKLPVLLSGQRALVDAILDILVAEADEWATTIKKPVTKNLRQNWREMCDLLRHTIMPSWGISHQSDRDQHRYIVINIKLMSEDCQEQLRDIFGQDFNDVQCDKEIAPSKWSLHSETVTLPSPKIRDRGDLMAHLKEKIMNVQDNIFWMTISWKTINTLKNSA